MQPEAFARGQLYAALAQAFQRPEQAAGEGESLAESLRQAANALDAETLGKVVDEMVGALEVSAGAEGAALLTLEIEYNRLFVGPGRPQAPPYESVYRDPRGLVMGPSAQAVVRRYAEAGLDIAPDRRDLPDHVATELGFMAYLVWQEAEVEGAAKVAWQERQHAFLREHLGVWLPRFCQQVRESSRHPFYTAVADLTQAFLELELTKLPM